MRKYGATVVPVSVLIQMQQNATLPWTPTKIVATVSIFLNRLSTIEVHLSSLSPHWGSANSNFDTASLMEDLVGGIYPYVTHDFVCHLYSGANASVRTMVLAMMYFKTIANQHPSLSYKVQHVFAGTMMIAMKQNKELFYSLEYYSNLFRVAPEEVTQFESDMLQLLHGHVEADHELYKAYEISMFNAVKSIDEPNNSSK